jgi:hypothetical protein
MWGRTLRHVTDVRLPMLVCSAASLYIPTVRCDPIKGSDDVKSATQVRTPEAYPFYRLTEVARHKTPESLVWVTYRDGVYDVTDFVKV